MTMKNLRIAFLCFSAIVLGLVVWNGLWPTKTIHQHGVVFSYPKKLTIQNIPSTEGNYANWQIMGSGSTITVSIPLKASSQKFTLLDNIQPWGKATDIVANTLAGHLGQQAWYREDSTSEGDIATHADVIFAAYPSAITDSPILVRYIHADGDNSLQAAWDKIQKTIHW